MLIRSIFVFAAISMSIPAMADVHISFVDDSGHPASQIYVKGDKVRMETGGGPEHAVMLYDAASNTAKMLMPARKAYLVFDAQTASQMGAQLTQEQGQMAAAQSQMQSAMANMSPQQRAALQQAMAAQGGSTVVPGQMSLPQMKLEDTGKSETIAGHHCKDMQMMVNGQPGMQMCVAAITSLGIPSADLATLKRMHDGMKKLMSHMGPMAQNMQSMLIDGFAIKQQHQHFEQYQMVTTTEMLKSVAKTPVPGNLFEVPAGYRQTSMQQLMQGAMSH